MDTITAMSDECSEQLLEQAQMLENEVPETKTQNDLKSELADKTKIKNKDLIKNVNNKVLIDILSPEITRNENAKRNYKLVLIILLTIFLTIQFISVYNLSLRVIDYATSATANYDIVKSLLAFVSAYIASVVVELIAILKYIVKNVFDKSLTKLVEIFKESNIKEQETT